MNNHSDLENDLQRTEQRYTVFTMLVYYHSKTIIRTVVKLMKNASLCTCKKRKIIHPALICQLDCPIIILVQGFTENISFLLSKACFRNENINEKLLQPQVIL